MMQQWTAYASNTVDLRKLGETDLSDDDAASSRSTGSGRSSERSSGASQTTITRSFCWADEDSDDDLEASDHEATDDTTKYTIVRLQKYGKGPPLLPVIRAQRSVPAQWPNDIAGWEQMDATGFTLPQYLQEFFSRLGIEAEIFDTLDGRQVVPYQAVVREKEWEHAWAQAEDFFKEQKTAYRQLLGVATAPKLEAKGEARFVALDLASLQASAPAPVVDVVDVVDEFRRTLNDKAASAPSSFQELPVKGTFIHFDGQAEEDSKKQPSSKSWS